jgi:hypothetical protein
MKRTIFVVLLMGVLTLSFAQTSLSGTYRYSTNAYITFTGNSFTGSWNSSSTMSGTYSVLGTRLTLNITGGTLARNTWTWTIVDANTLRDQDGDRWNKESTAAVPLTEYGPVPGTTFSGKMRWLAANAQSNTSYTVEVTADESIAPMPLSFSGKNNIHITLKAIGSQPIVFTLSAGSMFTVESGVTLILDGNLELQGRSNNYTSLIRINSGGSLIMNNGVKLSGNGGGVFVSSGGTFTMSGGEISGNASVTGGGAVGVQSGTFTMNGGKISGNTGGGGVFVSSGTFTMSGGEISGNTSAYAGGGVCVDSGTFTMSGGEISGNRVSDRSQAYGGGGVCVDNGTFTMSGGEISGNTAEKGGGVFVKDDTFLMNIALNGGDVMDTTFVMNFVMNGGKISGNTVRDGGGGVYVDSGTFILNNGEISGNTANRGGGVCVSWGTFSKTGGVIYGYSSTDSNSNRAMQANRGHAVYVSHSNSMYIMKKDATSGPRDNLSYNGYSYPPVSSGDWEWDF